MREGEGRSCVGFHHGRWLRFEVRRFAAAALMSFLFVAGVAHAHDPGLSVLELRIRQDHLAARVAFSATDAARVESGHLLEIQVDAKTLTPDSRERLVEASDVCFEFTYSLPPGAKVTLRSAAFDQLPSGHRQYLAIRDEANHLLFERILDAQARVIEISGPSAPEPTFGTFIA